jgi:predicted GIY-YIG superfamily endonuclease
MSHREALLALSSHFIKVPLVSGDRVFVYVLVNDDEVVYVGQSSNVAARIGSHAKNFAFDGALMLEVDFDERLAVEAALTRRFAPKNAKRVSLRRRDQDEEILARFGLSCDSAAASEICNRSSRFISPEKRTAINAAITFHAARRRFFKSLGVPRHMKDEARNRLVRRRLFWQAVEPMTRGAS